MPKRPHKLPTNFIGLNHIINCIAVEEDMFEAECYIWIDHCHFINTLIETTKYPVLTKVAIEATDNPTCCQYRHQQKDLSTIFEYIYYNVLTDGQIYISLIHTLIRLYIYAPYRLIIKASMQC